MPVRQLAMRIKTIATAEFFGILPSTCLSLNHAMLKNVIAKLSKVRTFGFLAVVIIAGKVLGFVKQMFIAYYFGASLQTDIINLAQGLIQNIDYVFTQMIITGFTAIYIHSLKKEENRDNIFVINTIKVFVGLALLAIVLVLACAPFIAKIIAPSYDQESISLLSKYLRIDATAILLFSLAAIFSSILNAHKRFVLVEVTLILRNTIFIVVLVALHQTMGVNALVVGFLAMAAIAFLHSFIFSKRHYKVTSEGVRSNPFRTEDIRALFKMLLPLLFGYAMIYVNQQVDKIIVSGMGEGVVTVLEYGSILTNLVTAFIASLCTVAFTHITEFFSSGKREEGAAYTLKWISILTFGLSFITIICFIASEDIVEICFLRGAFTIDNVTKTAIALRGYCFIFIPYAIKTLLNKFQYGDKKTKWPMINSIISIAFNIALSIGLSKWLGIFGVALATSIAEAIAALLNAISSKRAHPYLRFLPEIKKLPILIICAASCIALCLFEKSAFSSLNVVLRFSLITTTCGLVFFAPPLVLMLLKKKFLPKAKEKYPSPGTDDNTPSHED